MVDTHNISFRIPDGSGGSWSQNVPRICRYENGSFVDFKEVYVYKNGDFRLCWQKGGAPQKYYNYTMMNGIDGRCKIIKGSDFPIINSVALYVGIGGWEMYQGGVTNAWVYKMIESIDSTFVGGDTYLDAIVWQGISNNYSVQLELPDLTLYDGTSLPSSRDGTEFRKVTFTFTNPLNLSANKEYALMANRSSGVGTGKLAVYESDSSGVAITEDGFTYDGNFGIRSESPAELPQWGTKPYPKGTIEKLYFEINGVAI